MRFLLVLFLIAAGVAAVYVLPKYSKGVEESLAEDAVATVRMIATTNRMYSLDFFGRWTAGPIDNSCNNGDCMAHQKGALHAGCNLIVCNYLSRQDWDAKKYNFFALDGVAQPSATNPCGTFEVSRIWLACAVRKTPADGDPKAPKFSAGWAYAASKDGGTYAALQTPGSEPTPDPPRD